MLIAMVRPVSQAIINCELTHLAREPISFERAQAEHHIYEQRLAELGCRIHQLPSAPDLPDAVFVEDTAIVLDEIAVITRLGIESRRSETSSVSAALAVYRQRAFIEEPGQLEGGDVLLIDRTLFIGLSSRTNQAGIEQASALVAPFGYDVKAVWVTGCLHLKSAVTQVADNTLLINRRWLDDSAFAGMRMIDVDSEEPFAANALRIKDTIIYPSCYPVTQRKLEKEGITLSVLDITELRKAEAGVTCCSLIFRE